MGVALIIIGAYLLSGRLATLGNLGAFFNFLDETRVGTILLGVFFISLLVGLISGWWIRSKGKSFVDGMFLGAGLSFFALLLLYVVGAFSFLNI